LHLFILQQFCELLCDEFSGRCMSYVIPVPRRWLSVLEAVKENAVLVSNLLHRFKQINHRKAITLGTGNDSALRLFQIGDS